MSYFKVFGLLVLSVMFVTGQQTPDSSDSPWMWACRTGRGCVKVDKTQALQDGDTQAGSLASCKLTCNPYAMLWPRPRGDVKLSSNLVTFHLSELDVDVTTAPNDEVKNLMNEAVDVFRSVIQKSLPSDIKKRSTSNKGRQRQGPKVSLNIDITKDPSAVLTMETNEAYELSIVTQVSKTRSRQSTNTTMTTVTITADSFFGARHALETLSQLMAWDRTVSSLIMLSEATISDSPAFPHRGLLIDTSRNFMTLELVKKIIDAMSYNKLNVFHWHLTDTHSFPFVSKRQPLLSYYGAYSPDQVYRPEDIKDVVHYAMVRGVKVVPEYDAPAHVGSGWEWGEKNGLGQMVLCYNKEPWEEYCVEPPCGQLNPVNENIYPILNDIYKDMSELFQSDIFHMGGDEVHLRCWNETEEIVSWLKNMGRNDRTKADLIRVWTHFQDRALQELDKAYGNKQPVVLWTSGLTEEGEAYKYLDTNRYIIQVWTNETDKTIEQLYSQGFRLIMSNFDALYLDCGYGAWVGNNSNNWCSPYIGWQKVYSNSPRQMILNFNLTYDPKLVLGAEAALWSEQVDSSTAEGKLWPRSSAMAERLWTDPETDWRAAEDRMYHHRHRMVQRGILADALQPEWCQQHEGYCFL